MSGAWIWYSEAQSHWQTLPWAGRLCCAMEKWWNYWNAKVLHSERVALKPVFECASTLAFIPKMTWSETHFDIVLEIKKKKVNSLRSSSSFNKVPVYITKFHLPCLAVEIGCPQDIPVGLGWKNSSGEQLPRIMESLKEINPLETP